MGSSCVQECLEEEAARFVADLLGCGKGDWYQVSRKVGLGSINLIVIVLSVFLDVIELRLHVLNIHVVGMDSGA